MSHFPTTPRTTGRRLTERLAYDADLVHAILDEALVCHVGFEADGPLVLPMVHARVGDRLYLHVSTGSGAALACPTPACVTVTILDGLVLAKSQFNHSMNYRSVVVRGELVPVTEPAERDLALAAIVEHVWPGRSAASRPGNPKELAATRVLRIDLREVSAKVRTGQAKDEPEDHGLPYWAGIVALALRAGPAVAADHSAPTAPAPDPADRFG